MNQTNCSLLLKECRTFEELKQIHAQSIIQGLKKFQSLACKFLNFYAKFNKSAEAQLVYDQIPNPDVVSRTSLMSLYLQINRPHEAFSTFSEMIFSGLKLDRFAIVGALTACGRQEDLSRGKLVHGMIYRHNLGCDTFVDNALIDMYCRNGKIELAQMVFERILTKDVVSWTSLLHGHIKCKDLETACWVFDGMPVRNTISWTAMITGYVQGGKPIQGLQLFCWMKSLGEVPNAFTIVAVLSACAGIGSLDFGQLVHSYIYKSNMDADVAVSNALMDMYSKSGSVEMAEKVFKGMVMTDVFSWTTMVLCFAIHGDGNKAIQAFIEMLISGMSPNDVTFLGVLSACSHAGLINEGKRWFYRMKEIYRLEPKIEHYGCMVDLLGRAGLLKEAMSLVEQMQIEPDVVIWRSLLSASLAHGNSELATLAGKKIIEKEPGDDGVYVLLWNMHAAANRWIEALEMRKMMKDRRVVKKPGSSWIEVNGVVHEFLVEDKTHYLRREIYSVLEGISKILRLGY